MSEDHIRFFELEPEDSIDEMHVASCRRCQQDRRLFRLLRFQIASAPRIDPPPFFSARVTSQLKDRAPGLFLFSRFARRLSPFFALLLLATGFLLFRASRETTVEPIRSNLLFDEQKPDSYYLEYVVNSLQQPAEEDFDFEKSK